MRALLLVFLAGCSAVPESRSSALLPLGSPETTVSPATLPASEGGVIVSVVDAAAADLSVGVPDMAVPPWSNGGAATADPTMASFSVSDITVNTSIATNDPTWTITSSDSIRNVLPQAESDALVAVINQVLANVQAGVPVTTIDLATLASAQQALTDIAKNALSTNGFSAP